MERISLEARLVRWIELGARLLEQGKRGQITLRVESSFQCWEKEGTD